MTEKEFQDFLVDAVRHAKNKLGASKEGFKAACAQSIMGTGNKEGRDRFDLRITNVELEQRIDEIWPTIPVRKQTRPTPNIII